MRRKLKLSNDLILEVLQFTSRSDLDYYVLLSRRIRQLIDTHFAYFPMRQAESISLTREGSGETFALRGDLRDQPSCLLFEGNFAQSFSISTDAIRASFVDKVKVLSTERRESVHYASWMSLMSTIEHARIQELAFVNMDFTNIPVELFQRLSFASFATLYLRDCLLRAAHLNNGFLRFLKKPEINLVLSNITPSDGDFFELDGEEIIEFCSKSDAQVGNVQRRLNAHHVTLSSGFFTRLIQAAEEGSIAEGIWVQLHSVPLNLWREELDPLFPDAMPLYSFPSGLTIAVNAVHDTEQCSVIISR